jgi:hypothetical protein
MPRLAFSLAAWGIALGIGLMASAPTRAQETYPSKTVPQIVQPAPQMLMVAQAPQATPQILAPTNYLAPTPALAASPAVLTTAPAVSYPSYATPQGSPQASPQSMGPSCACYYPQGRCPFPSGNCAYPQGNCVAPAGSCVGGPCPGWPQGSPQFSPQVSPQVRHSPEIPTRTASTR